MSGPHIFCPHCTPFLPCLAWLHLVVNVLSVWVGQTLSPVNLGFCSEGPFLVMFSLLHQTTTNATLAWHPVPPNWPFGDCLLPSCIAVSLLYMSPSGGANPPFYPHLECNMLQRIAVVWIGLRCFRLNATQRAVSLPLHPPPHSHVSHFDILISGPFLKCQQKLGTGYNQFNPIQFNKRHVGRRTIGENNVFYSASDDTMCSSNCAAEEVSHSTLFCFSFQNLLTLIRL